MATLAVDELLFHLQPNISASKYDEWIHYRTVLQPRSKKAVDVAAARSTTHPPCCWLIEVKDFRQLRGEPGEKNQDLPATVTQKALDTLDGLQDAASAATDAHEQSHAALMLRAATAQVVLHLEAANTPSRLFQVPNPANILQKMRQILKQEPRLHKEPIVTCMANNRGLPWTVTAR